MHPGMNHINVDHQRPRALVQETGAYRSGESGACGPPVFPSRPRGYVGIVLI